MEVVLTKEMSALAESPISEAIRHWSTQVTKMLFPRQARSLRLLPSPQMATLRSPMQHILRQEQWLQEVEGLARMEGARAAHFRHPRPQFAP